MLSKIIRNQKAMLFIGGMVSAVIAGKFLKSKAAHDLAVKSMAAGMRLQKDALEKLHNVKEEAADILHDECQCEEEVKEEEV